MHGNIMQSKVKVEPPSSDRIGPKFGTDSPTNKAAITTQVLSSALFHVKSKITHIKFLFIFCNTASSK